MQVRQNLDGGVTHNFKPGWAWDVTWMELRCYFLDHERCNTSPGWMWNVWKAIWVFIQHFPILGIISRYREINFRYREIINFPISGNDFGISAIDFPILGNLLDFPISGNQFPIYPKIATTEAGHSGSCNTALPHRPSINNEYQPHQHQLHVETIIRTLLNHSVNTEICGT